MESASFSRFPVEFKMNLVEFFEGIAAKYLSAVDADPKRSHQHEIGGLPSVGFKQFLGEPSKGERYNFPARMVYLTDEDDSIISFEDQVTWYDCREKQLKRSPEYRLYYKTNPVTSLLQTGDFFLIAKLKNNALLLVFTPAHSSIEHQLRSLFALDDLSERFAEGTIDKGNLLLPLRLLLEELGIDIFKAEAGDDEWLKQLFTKFGEAQFPTTSQFSSFARESLQTEINPLTDPDATLLAWMEREEKLFRIFERYLVQQQLKIGFGENGHDVDAFISFSLSVQNRRKSRAGHAFESHLASLFSLNKLHFEQGRGKLNVTEHNAKPDFLFPSFHSYHNATFPTEKLRLLGAKTTCKDRWRQVLSEGKRIQYKHLITLEPAISELQTQEMQAHKLQLVVPDSIQSTYTTDQQHWLISLSDFILELKSIQS